MSQRQYMVCSNYNIQSTKAVSPTNTDLAIFQQFVQSHELTLHQLIHLLNHLALPREKSKTPTGMVRRTLMSTKMPNVHVRIGRTRQVRLGVKMRTKVPNVHVRVSPTHQRSISVKQHQVIASVA